MSKPFKADTTHDCKHKLAPCDRSCKNFCKDCGTSHATRCRECNELLSKVDHVFEEALCVNCAMCHSELDSMP